MDKWTKFIKFWVNGFGGRKIPSTKNCYLRGTVGKEENGIRIRKGFITENEKEKHLCIIHLEVGRAKRNR